MLWEVEWWTAEVYESLGVPFASLPFLKWDELWSSLGQLGWEAWVLNLSVMGVFTLLLLWARRQDRHSEYKAYMPSWYTSRSNSYFPRR